jgi:hypothetical protein
MLYVLMSVGGLIVFVASFSERGRVQPRWSRIALWMIGCAVVVWSMLGVLLVYKAISLSPITRDLLFAIKNMLSGLALGQLLLLFLAGGFSPHSSKARSQGEHEGKQKT